MDGVYSFYNYLLLGFTEYLEKNVDKQFQKTVCW